MTPHLLETPATRDAVAPRRVSSAFTEERVIDAQMQASTTSVTRHEYGRTHRRSVQSTIRSTVTSTRQPSFSRSFALAVAIGALIPATPARADLIKISWDASGGFERVLDIAPGAFAEVCGRLTKGQAVAWSFKSRQGLNFNIHYHAGKKAVFPAKQDQIATLDGELKVPVDQDYCWMWENKASQKATLRLTLRRR